MVYGLSSLAGVTLSEPASLSVMIILAFSLCHRVATMGVNGYRAGSRLAFPTELSSFGQADHDALLLQKLSLLRCCLNEGLRSQKPGGAERARGDHPYGAPLEIVRRRLISLDNIKRHLSFPLLPMTIVTATCIARTRPSPRLVNLFAT